MIAPGVALAWPCAVPQPAAAEAARTRSAGIVPAVNALRRVLYVQAAAWAVAGLSLAIVPRVVVATVFGQARPVGDAWVRSIGVQAFGYALLMVLVGHRVEELFWWSWAFAIVTTGLAAVSLLNAAFGLAAGDSGALWWTFGVITAVFAFALLYGLFLASQEQPLP